MSINRYFQNFMDSGVSKTVVELSRSATVLSCPRFRFHAMTTPKLDHRHLSIEPIEAHAALVVRFVSSYKVISGACISAKPQYGRQKPDNTSIWIELGQPNL